jgi:hypothetical protein
VFSEENATGFGKPYGFCIAVEKRDTKLILQISDLSAKRGLRHVKARCRARHILFFGDRHEVPQMTEFHLRPIIPDQYGEPSNKVFPLLSLVDSVRAMTVPLERLTPDNAALLLIDHQVGLFTGVRDIPAGELKHNVIALAKALKVLGVPIIVTATSPEMWGPTIPELTEALPGISIINRTTVNAFDEPRFAKGSRGDRAQEARYRWRFD